MAGTVLVVQKAKDFFTSPEECAVPFLALLQLLSENRVCGKP